MNKKITKEIITILSISLFVTLLGIAVINIPYIFFGKGKAHSEYQKYVEGKEKVDISDEPSMIIPSLEIKVPITFTSSTNEGQILEDLKDGLSHRAGTAMPGGKGNVFITGHSSGYPWEEGNYNQVFISLNNLEKGDIIFIDYKAKRYTYRIKEKKIVRPDDISVMNQTDSYSLTTMTCYPPGTILRRLVVISELEK